jgi:hypothetical protein
MKINWVIEYLKDLFTKKECSGCHKRFNPRVIIPFHGKMWCPECWRKISIIRKAKKARKNYGKSNKGKERKICQFIGQFMSVIGKTLLF